MASTMLVIFSIILGLCGFFRALLHFTHSSQEPQAVETTIPFVSPFIGIARKGVKYWNTQMGLPIYTLRLPGIRVYIVNSTSLIPTVQAQAKTISFSPVLVQVAKNVIGVSERGLEIISRNPVSSHGFILGIHKTTRLPLAPGLKLTHLSEIALDEVSKTLNGRLIPKDGLRMGLYEWISHEVISATGKAVYGPEYPFSDPEAVEAWHLFNPGLVPLLLNVMPFITTRKYHRARSILAKVFENYYLNGGHDHPKTSALIKDRKEFFDKYGLTIEDAAKVEAVTSVALLGNIVLGTFWLVYHITSDTELLKECRLELSGAVRDRDGVGVIDMDYVKNSCSLMNSTYHEMLRVYATGSSSRGILEDHMLDNRYLLKKGSILLIPAGVQHHSTSEWGQDVNEFNSRRFLTSTSPKKGHDSVAFRAFGGGVDRCPGRFLATTEILAFATLILLRFNISPVAGRWTRPTIRGSTHAITLSQPDHDIEVELGLYDDRMWSFAPLRPLPSNTVQEGSAQL